MYTQKIQYDDDNRPVFDHVKHQIVMADDPGAPLKDPFETTARNKLRTDIKKLERDWREHPDDFNRAHKELTARETAAKDLVFDKKVIFALGQRMKRLHWPECPRIKILKENRPEAGVTEREKVQCGPLVRGRRPDVVSIGYTTRFGEHVPFVTIDIESSGVASYLMKDVKSVLSILAISPIGWLILMDADMIIAFRFERNGEALSKRGEPLKCSSKRWYLNKRSWVLYGQPENQFDLGRELESFGDTLLYAITETSIHCGDHIRSNVCDLHIAGWKNPLGGGSRGAGKPTAETTDINPPCRVKESKIKQYLNEGKLSKICWHFDNEKALRAIVNKEVERFLHQEVEKDKGKYDNWHVPWRSHELNSSDLMANLVRDRNNEGEGEPRPIYEESVSKYD